MVSKDRKQLQVAATGTTAQGQDSGSRWKEAVPYFKEAANKTKLY